MTRDEFIKYFGNPNKKKHNRCSWSGKCVPIFGEYNECGQILKVDKNNNICIFYKYNKDKRTHSKEYEFLKTGKILIVVWLKNKMERHINKKFNSNGFFICKKMVICIIKYVSVSHLIMNILLKI